MKTNIKKSMKNNKKKFYERWLGKIKRYPKWPFVLGGISLAVLILTKCIPILASLYSDYIYHNIVQILSTFTGFFPFSIAEWLLYFFVTLFIIFFIRFWVLLIIKRGERKRVLKNYLHGIGCIVCLLFSIFVWFCGINYSRKDFADYIGLEKKAASTTQLKELCEYLMEQTNNARQSCGEDENGVFSYQASTREMAKKANKAYENIAVEYEALGGHFGLAKGIFASDKMSYTKIVGIFVPYTLEANVNQDVPKFNTPADICHELAHLRGFMKEEEANFIAYLVCVQSEEPEFVYSGNLLALIYAVNALGKEDSAAYEEVMGKLSQQVKADMEQEEQYWLQYEKDRAATTVAKVTDQVNDTYLKVNGISSGVKNYGEMVDLLLNWYEKNK